METLDRLAELEDEEDANPEKEMQTRVHRLTAQGGRHPSEASSGEDHQACHHLPAERENQ